MPSRKLFTAIAAPAVLTLASVAPGIRTWPRVLRSPAGTVAVCVASGRPDVGAQQDAPCVVVPWSCPPSTTGRSRRSPASFGVVTKPQ